MLEVIRQETSKQIGNDCLIDNCCVVLKCHERFIVVNIRKYSGWCDDGKMDFRDKKEFERLYDALEYYEDLKKYYE